MPELLLRATSLPVPHGFSTRHGGVSEGAFASLNVSVSVGDERSRVEENLRRLCAAGGVQGIATVTQVHGDSVRLAPAGARDALEPLGEADALISRESGQAVGIRTADCVPIVLVDPICRQVAAVHSGWRGTEKRIVARAVDALVAHGARADRLLAAIGPCIRACCYQVSAELARTFTDAFGPQVVQEGGGGQRLDLVAAVEATLRASGVRQIEQVAPCTHCEAGSFFSHRRDAGRTGRHLSFVACAF